jgi:hypothetical protein
MSDPDRHVPFFSDEEFEALVRLWRWIAQKLRSLLR